MSRGVLRTFFVQITRLGACFTSIFVAQTNPLNRVSGCLAILLVNLQTARAPYPTIDISSVRCLFGSLLLGWRRSISGAYLGRELLLSSQNIAPRLDTSIHSLESCFRAELGFRKRRKTKSRKALNTDIRDISSRTLSSPPD